jgi:3-oxoacyl-[acyl-carrier-protein] synthase III
MPTHAQPATLILGTGRYAPAKIVSNFDLEKMVDTSDAWITERTGIRERRIAAEGEETSDMAAAAARSALGAAGLQPSDLDMIIVGTVTGDVPMPATAVYVQQKIGAGPIPAFDISAACAGFVYGLSIADQFIRNGQMKHVLVVGVELLSRVLNWEDRTTCVLFGDGAGAVVLGPSIAPKNGEARRGVISTKIFTDGSLASSLSIPGGGSRIPLSHAALDERKNKVHMVGSEVFKVAVKNLSSASREAIEASGMSAGDIDWVVAHQANMRIITQVANRLDIPLERFVLNIERYGNTSSASIPIALDEAVRDGRIKPGQTVLMCALGAGISWGSALVRM